MPSLQFFIFLMFVGTFFIVQQIEIRRLRKRIKKSEEIINSLITTSENTDMHE